MPETANIARMAELISNDIFDEFGWERTGPVNENWECVIPEHQRKTHPADVVFWYQDPYSAKRIYVMTDLKSYASNSITKTMIGQALRGLALATECSQLSSVWRNLYVPRDTQYQPVGLLFVFNHDGRLRRIVQQRPLASSPRFIPVESRESYVRIWTQRNLLSPNRC